MKTEKVKVSKLQENPDNPRLLKKDKKEKLEKSIKEFPEMLEARPIVVNKDYTILGGNMRYKALVASGAKEADVLVVDWSEDKQREFIIKDNVGFGEWDWDDLATWDQEELIDWGMELPEEWGLNPNELTEEFVLPDGDKEPFEQMTFTLADKQADQIRNAIQEIKHTEEYKYCETMGNENSNGNALYLIIMQWVEQKT